MTQALAEGPMTGNGMCIYYSTTFGSGAVNTLISAVSDVSLDTFEREMVEYAARGSVYKKKIAGMMEAPTITCKLFHNVSRTIEDALQAALIAGTVLNITIMNGPSTTSGTRGISMPMLISKMPWSQNLSEVSSRDITFELAYYVSGSAEVDPTIITTT